MPRLRAALTTNDLYKLLDVMFWIIEGLNNDTYSTSFLR